jgi:ubiquinone biosynthesis protein UbiJ
MLASALATILGVAAASGGRASGGVEALVTTTSAPHATRADRETLLSRALGRALAHEIGHSLMKSKAHARRGLMRSAWRAQEFFSADRRGFSIGVSSCRSASR